VVGIGAVAVGLGLRSAGVIFVGCMIAVSGTVGLYLSRRPAPAT
jgi:hypothetical protein